MRLSPDTLDQLPAGTDRFTYDRGAQKIGIVHFGLGAFARAHLAAYCDAAMEAGEGDWMITGVSLRSDNVSRQLNPQRGLYTLTQRSGASETTRVMGAIGEVLEAWEADPRIIDAVASPDCRLVTFTVTEKGYGRASDGSLDLDLANTSFYPLLAIGLEQRMKAGLPGVTLLSCDNLHDNGGQLHKLLMQYLSSAFPGLLDWFLRECTCPNSMVDRIVPATAETDRDVLEARLGMRDEGAIFTERFTQWVIEDLFAGPRPRWEEQGVQIVRDVAPYEAAKHRMLNGAHSLMAYVGLAAGHSHVHEAMADPAIRGLVNTLMLEEAAPSVETAPGQDLTAYAARLIERFDDPALAHRLAQIAMDGSQKIPQRWLAVLARMPGLCPAILTGIAAWLHHISDGQYLDDPQDFALRSVVEGKSVADQVERIFGEEAMLTSGWMPTEADIAFIEKAHAQLGVAGGI